MQCQYVWHVLLSVSFLLVVCESKIKGLGPQPITHLPGEISKGDKKTVLVELQVSLDSSTSLI